MPTKDNTVPQIIGYTEKALTFKNNEEVFVENIRRVWPHRFGPLTMSNVDRDHFRLFNAVFKEIKYQETDDNAFSSRCIDFQIAGQDTNDILNLMIDMTQSVTVIARESEHVVSMCFDISNEVLRSAYEWESN